MSNLLDTHLKGKRITSFVIHEHTSELETEGGYSMGIEGLCRYLGADGAFIASGDHGHKFGLPSPYNAESAINNKIVGKVISKVTIRENSNDVTLHLSDGVLEIICTSSGYETCQLHGPKDLFIVIGRGRVIHE